MFLNVYITLGHFNNSSKKKKPHLWKHDHLFMAPPLSALSFLWLWPLSQTQRLNPTRWALQPRLDLFDFWSFMTMSRAFLGLCMLEFHKSWYLICLGLFILWQPVWENWETLSTMSVGSAQGFCLLKVVVCLQMLLGDCWIFCLKKQYKNIID